MLKYSERHQESWLSYTLLLGVTFAIYGRALFYGFVWDDGPYVQTNFRIQGLSPAHLRQIWLTPFLGHFAPVHNFFLALVYAVAGMNPFAYHLFQLLLHAACLCVLYGVLTEIESSGVALLACLLLAVHPTTIETAVWIAESKSTLAFLFFLLSFRYYLRLRRDHKPAHWLLSAVFLILSLLSKINTVVAPAIFVLYELKARGRFDRSRVMQLGSLFAISGAMTVIHLLSFYGASGVPGFTYYPGGLPVHLLNLPTLLLFYVRMTLFPYPQSGWHLIPIYGNLNLPLCLEWLAVVVLAGIVVRCNRDIQFWTLWFVIFLLPVLQIVPFPIWVAERYLYIPAVGIFVIVGRGWFCVWDRYKRAPWRWAWASSAAIVVCALSVQSFRHLSIWESDLSFWEATTQTCAMVAYCHTSLGNALLRNGQTDRAIQELTRAAEIRPIPANLINLGDAYVVSRMNVNRGIQILQTVSSRIRGVSPVELYASLGRAYLIAGDVERAASAVQNGFRIYPGDPKLLTVNAFLQQRLGNRAGALQSLQVALPNLSSPAAAVPYLIQFWGDPAAVRELLEPAPDGLSG